MSTPYSTIFTAFLGKMENDIYDNMDQQNAENDMIILLNSALVNFEYPKINIFDKDDSLMTFNEDLGYYEIQILSGLMKLEWVKRLIHNRSLLIQRFTTRDISFTSQAAHLQSLMVLKGDIEKELQTLKTVYSYKNTDSNQRPNYSGLSGSD